MVSDILILLKKALNEQETRMISHVIYKMTQSAIVSFQPERRKILLVKFDPEKDDPKNILDAVREAGFDAVMAGG